MKTLAFLFLLTSIAHGQQKGPCAMGADACCQDCAQRYQICDWRHDTLGQQTQCLVHENQCMTKCQKQRSHKIGMSINSPPVDSNRQLSGSDEPNLAEVPTDSDE